MCQLSRGKTANAKWVVAARTREKHPYKRLQLRRATSEMDRNYRKGSLTCRRLKERKRRSNRGKKRERERRSRILHANRVTFASFRKLERAQWEFNEARRRRKPSQEMEHLQCQPPLRSCLLLLLLFF